MKQKIGIEKCHYKPDMATLKKMFEWTDDFERNREHFEAKLNLYRKKVVPAVKS